MGLCECRKNKEKTMVDLRTLAESGYIENLEGTVIGATTPSTIAGTTGSFSGDLTIADKIVHSGDTNTAIRFPAADTVTVETNGAERMRVDSSGSVGIGTTSPSNKLEVSVANAAFQTALSLTNKINYASGRGPAIAFRVPLDTPYTIDYAGGRIGSTSEGGAGVGNSNLIFETAAGQTLTERMRIDSTGNVGIGTTSGTDTLRVNGGIRSLREAFNDGLVLLGPVADSTYLYGSTSVGMIFNVGVSERMRITSAGNVGIGTTSPNSKLQVITGTNLGGVLIGFNGGSSNFYDADLNVFRKGDGTERMRIDSAGNVGIGVTPLTDVFSPNFQVKRTILNGGLNDRATLSYNYYRPSGVNTYIASDFATSYVQISGQHAWLNAPSGTAGNPITFTQVMTLDASGNLSLGTTSSGGTLTVTPTGAAYTGLFSGAPDGFNIACRGGSTTGTAIRILNGSGTAVGSITYTASATAYNTSSDYRLKENVAPMQNALDTVAQLNPVTYTWKADGSSGQGFIAHELQAVVPDCVTGEKDAVDKDGNPQYQGVDTSFLVATLVKAIQEQQAIITELNNRITTLENK
jgi:hypothetical protein